MTPKGRSRTRELEQAAVCGEQAVTAIRRSIDGDVLVTDGWLYYEEQAIRMARLAMYHACKAQPWLKPPDSYAAAVDAYRNTIKGGDR